VIILIGLVSVLVVPRLRDRARRRRAENEHRANEERMRAIEERIKVVARDLDGKVTYSEDGGPQYREEV
jgi:type II secretory pathway pseudopilin PulG